MAGRDSNCPPTSTGRRMELFKWIRVKCNTRSGSVGANKTQLNSWWQKKWMWLDIQLTTRNWLAADVTKCYSEILLLDSSPTSKCDHIKLMWDDVFFSAEREKKLMNENLMWASLTHRAHSSRLSVVYSLNVKFEYIFEKKEAKISTVKSIEYRSKVFETLWIDFLSHSMN